MNKSTATGVVAAIGLVMASGIAAYIYLGKKVEVGEQSSNASTPRIGSLTQTAGRPDAPRPTVAARVRVATKARGPGTGPRRRLSLSINRGHIRAT